jgi:1,4-alpha-glucan branching enzyme
MLPLPLKASTIPLGGTVAAGGAAFRVWAPRATAIYLLGDFNHWTVGEDFRLQSLHDETWAGFLAGAGDGTRYTFHVRGSGGEIDKRDPHARCLTFQPHFPDCHCILRDPASFPWHDTGYRTPAFHKLILYQLHVGTFRIAAGNKEGKFFDVMERLPYLEALGVNGLQLMPIVEFATEFSLGYNGTDYFSPENDYAENDPANAAHYFDLANRLLAAKGCAPYPSADLFRSADHQLRALVDLCHVYGIAVLFDVVYNHAGGGFDDKSIYFFDEMPRGDNNESLYFTDQGWAGGLVFAYWNDNVQEFLIDNARAFYREYRIDGFRFDEVSVMDRFGGWRACQAITGTLRYEKPEAIQIAEYWPVNPAVTRAADQGGAGFDATWQDGLRNAVRGAIAEAAGGWNASVDMGSIAAALASRLLPADWQSVQCVENHDIIKRGEGQRIPRLADPSDSRSWYARSRSRVATGLLMTAPGIPMLFMGQEFLEDKQFSDDPSSGNLIWWAGLEGGNPDKTMADHLRFTTDLIHLRWRQPALCDGNLRVHYVDNTDRVLAFHRWREGFGDDVVVIANLREATFWEYRIGFPGTGDWLEVFNSDVYDNWVNPMVAGNHGGVSADATPMHGMPASAAIVMPANTIVVFARNSGY